MSQEETRAYENTLSEYYDWHQRLLAQKKGTGCPICGKGEKGLSKFAKQVGICQACSDAVLDHKKIIQKHLFEKAVRQETISSNEIPFLISLSDEEKYDFLYQLLEKKGELGKKGTLELVRTFISYFQIPTNTDYFYDIFYPVFLKEFTSEPGLLPVWCAGVPVGMKGVKKPGEMIHYIDTLIISEQKAVQKKKKSGKLLSLTWGREKVYSMSLEGEDTEWEYFEKYRGMVIITSERIIPLHPDGSFPFIFQISRITSLTIKTGGLEITLDGHGRPFRLEGLNTERGDNIRFCMERLVKKGTVIKHSDE